MKDIKNIYNCSKCGKVLENNEECDCDDRKNKDVGCIGIASCGSKIMLLQAMEEQKINNLINDEVYDEYDLTGLKLTNEQKESLRKLEISPETILQIMGPVLEIETKDLTEEHVMLVEELVADLSKKKDKRWKKKYFYD